MKNMFPVSCVPAKFVVVRDNGASVESGLWFSCFVFVG
jgi:hypothetical protein